MSNQSKMKQSKNRMIKLLLVISFFIIILYLIGVIYFSNHCFFNTVINGVNVSLDSPDDIQKDINAYVSSYKILLIMKDRKEELSGNQLGLCINNKNSVSVVRQKQNSFWWIISLFQHQQYELKDLYSYHENALRNKIHELNESRKDLIKPQNVQFYYTNRAYQVREAVFGNIIDEEKLYAAIRTSVLSGKEVLNLEQQSCYEYPKYTLRSPKTIETKKLLDQYVSTMIIYRNHNTFELIDGNLISKWISVNDDLGIILDKNAVKDYVYELSKKFDTVGIERKFKSSIGRVVTVKGGLYGWKIDREAEVKAILDYIYQGEVIERKPIFSQSAICEGENDIGNTYVEIDITRQHIWFYKEGKLIAEGAVVTGNPNRGNATAIGTYMIVYKQNIATLKGANYEVEVTYWMPFYGNMGIHDARWRSSFGGEIYKSRGTHGCVNAPYHLAKKIFDNIDIGTPVICYKEDDDK